MKKVLRSMFVATLVLASLSFWVSSASAGGGCFHEIVPTDGTGDTVAMTGNCFEATVLHVDPGTKVTWVNEDSYTHMVIGVGGTWGTFEELAEGDSVSYRFDENGVYLYSCLIHPGMVGAVVVGDGSGDAGLDPAAVVPLPKAAPPAADSVAATTQTTADGDSKVALGAAIAGLLGISIGLVLARARSRTRRGMVQELG